MGFQQVGRGIAARAPCSLCGHENDDYFHRLVECTNPDAEELRAKVDQVFLDEVTKGGRDNVRGQVLTCTKILGFTRTNVLVNIVEQEDWGGLEPTPENFAFDPERPMYADGSCYEGTDPDFAATGGSCVQVNEATGMIIRSARATLPEWMDQSAASGEHYGCHLGVLFTPRKPTIHADCASVVRSATSREYAVDWRRPFAGLWKEIAVHVWPNVIQKNKGTQDAGRGKGVKRPPALVR